MGSMNEGKVVRDEVSTCWVLQTLTLSEMESIWKTIMLPGESHVSERFASSLTSCVLLGKSPTLSDPHFSHLQDGHDHAHSAELVSSLSPQLFVP